MAYAGGLGHRSAYVLSFGYGLYIKTRVVLGAMVDLGRTGGYGWFSHTIEGRDRGFD